MVSDLTHKIQMDNACNIQFTSGVFNQFTSQVENEKYLGTTGKPKGVTLSHHNVVNNAHQIGYRIGYNEKVKKAIIVLSVTEFCFSLIVSVFRFHFIIVSGV